jgi:hypothetical protein
MQQDATFMKFFPDKMSKGRIPSREYFFNVLNTVMEDYLQGLIKHANKERNSAESEHMQNETIICSNKMWE